MRQLFFFFSVLLLAPSLAGAKRPGPGLMVEPRLGKPPLAVKITGPESFLARVRECRRTFGGWGFHVDWGDGSQSKPSEGKCLAELTHDYTVPGKYLITVMASHPGPTDAPVIDFRGTAAVEISAPSAEVLVKVALAERKPGDQFWGGGLPHLKFRVETGQELTLTAELVKEKGGEALFTETKPVSFTGDASIYWARYGNGPPGEHFDGEGKVRVFYRLRAMAAGKTLAEDKSNPFTLHASVKFRTFEVKPLVGNAPLEVKASTRVFHSRCYSYLVDWGDGTPETFRGRPDEAGKSCRLDPSTIELTHTYKKKGSYSIRWHDNGANPFEPARKGPGYMENRVEVR